MIRSNEISRNAITRLYQYRKSLYRLRQMGFIRVFSENLADAVSVTASQIRRDFSMFGLMGNKRGGYSIDGLIKILDQKLGKDKQHNVIVVGAGNIGRALMNYKGFQQEGIKVVAVFDTDERKVSKEGPVPVLPLAHMKEYIRAHKIEIGVLAVPETQAQQVLDDMVKASIKGVLNFAPIRLNPPGEEFIINHVDLGLELETVIYLVHSLDKKKKE